MVADAGAVSPVEGARAAPVIVDRRDLSGLLAGLRARGYGVIGPTIREGAVVHAEIDSDEELPVGWTDEQEPGAYRLQRIPEPSVFGHTVGPQSWKPFLFPPSSRVFATERHDGEWRVVEEDATPPRLALVGVRACDLAGIAIQDRVFLGGAHRDRIYAERREGAFIVAVNCGRSAATCFCASMGTGPQATSGFDLALTEVLEGERHHFVVEVGSERGADVLHDVPHRPAGDAEVLEAREVVARTARGLGRRMETAGIREVLATSQEHPRWKEVADRCLSCGNCTMVCPTCFCSTVEDVTDLSGDHAERRRRWESCFTLDHSHIHGGSIRVTPRSRYRQWLTHKLGTWIDQFGGSGCVGCGRCITWCPVGIDITEEMAALRGDASVPRPEESST